MAYGYLLSLTLGFSLRCFLLLLFDYLLRDTKAKFVVGSLRVLAVR